MTQEQIQTIDDFFSGYGTDSNGYKSISKYYHFQKPSSIYDLKDIVKRDTEIANYINELTSQIEVLKTMRIAYAERYNELSVSPVKKAVRLKRQKSYYENKVYYYISYVDIYEDGHEEITKTDKFTGKERKTAIENYNAYVKAHPGIIADMDIEKGKWERWQHGEI